MKKLLIVLEDSNKTFNNESECLSEFLSQVLMFNDSFIKLKILTNSEDYSYCPFDVDFNNFPFDIGLSELSSYINIWTKFLDRKGIDNSDSYILFKEENYKFFIGQLSINQYSEEMKEVLRDMEATSRNIVFIFNKMGSSIVRELTRRMYPFDVPFESVSSGLSVWVKSMLSND